MRRQRRRTGIRVQGGVFFPTSFPSFDFELHVPFARGVIEGDYSVFARQMYKRAVLVRRKIKWTYREFRYKNASREFTESPRTREKHQGAEAPKFKPSQAKPVQVMQSKPVKPSH